MTTKEQSGGAGKQMRPKSVEEVATRESYPCSSPSSIEFYFQEATGFGKADNKQSAEDSTNTTLWC